MATEVKVPEISEGVESATVTEILVSEGDEVEKDQSIISVESDKAALEIPSSHSGTVQSIEVEQDEEVNIGDVILIVEEAGGEQDAENEGEEKDQEGEGKEDKKSPEEEAKEEEEEDEKKKDSDEKEEPETKGEKKDGKEEEKEAEKEETEDKQEKESIKTDDKDRASVAASPGVRRFARELGIDISKVDGSGDKGRISKADVKAHSKGRKSTPQPTTDLPDFGQWGKTERQKLSGIRKATAKTVSSSWQNIPHVTQFDEADITAIEAYMAKNRDKAEKAGGKLTITAVLTKLVASALERFPAFNASLDLENQEMILKHYINIGIAVDTKKGLLMPVIRDVNTKNIIDLSVEIVEIAEKARNQKLTSEEMEGGNFSISNQGGIGGTNFTPIIYEPQAAILGISRSENKLVLKDGEPEERSVLPLSLSYDHRLNDGADAARFITWLKNSLEDPFEALMA